jgi:hypothetical protein
MKLMHFKKQTVNYCHLLLNSDYKNEKFFTSYVFHYVLPLWYRTVIAIHIMFYHCGTVQ